MSEWRQEGPRETLQLSEHLAIHVSYGWEPDTAGAVMFDGKGAGPLFANRDAAKLYAVERARIELQQALDALPQPPEGE